MARAYTALDGSYQMLGQPEKAVHESMALEIYTTLGHTRSLGITELNLGVQAYSDGRWDEAVRLYERAQEDCSRAGDRQHTAIAGANLGELLVSRGDLDEAERVLTDARRVLRSSGFTPFALFAETQLARCALERGEAPEALASLSRIVEEAGGSATPASCSRSPSTSPRRRRSPETPPRGSRLSTPPQSRRARKRRSSRCRSTASAPRACCRWGGRTRLRRASIVHSSRRSDRAFCTSSCSSVVPGEAFRGERDPEEASEELREAGRLAQLLGVAI